MVLALILREMTTRYGLTPGVYVWALLGPLGGGLILALGFWLIAPHPPLRTRSMPCDAYRTAVAVAGHTS